MKIIKKAKQANRKKGKGNYYEKHHILPKSLYPRWKYRSRNWVLLTPREHFFCHLLLEKIFPCSQMALAAYLLKSAYDSQGHKIFISSKKYEELRIKIIDMAREKASGKNNHMYGRRGPLHPSWGRKVSDEEREKRRQRILGKKNPMYGKRHSDETIDRLKKTCGSQIRCIETGEIFVSQKTAAIALNIQTAGIIHVLRGEWKQTGGYSFEYVHKKPRSDWDENKRKRYTEKRNLEREQYIHAYQNRRSKNASNNP